MADMSLDPWVVANSRNISPERLHAIGVITLRWNECEFWLFHLFCGVSGLSQKDAWTLVHDLGDVAICIRIKTFADQRGYHTDGLDLISNALQAYDITRQNRNTISHAWMRNNFALEDTLARKSKKPDSFDAMPFESDLTTLRQVADEMSRLEMNLWLLCCVIEDATINGPLTSPRKLALPVALWMPPPPVRTKQMRPPQPSRA
ncbi:hypothetical protein FJ414_23420 [Mesorhizobium sp. B3-1-6]|uniref:hypothetical protein n=1 Tax=Mesorhizobium sp. B3-1-6 TaxID=2589895 RepID=UPI001129BF44|nr:hypothetical protein [Mesorhizobium sp. B3-1-6]TPI31511.1 hypothetical protein FJ414_23420 [Mesorhizobium sp. B3-1-6]